MNALLNITIRVNKQGTAQINQLQKQLTGLKTGASGKGANAAAAAINNFNTAANAGSKATQSFGQMLSGAAHKMTSFGKNITWTGRQLTMFYTVPLLAAAAAGFAWGMANEKAFTQLKKVSGDSLEMLEKHKEIARALSDSYGVAQDQVLETMATFAQAGAGGLGLDKLTQEAIEFSELADQDLAKSTEQIIMMMGQYGLTTKDVLDDTLELHTAISMLNSVENATQVSMSDLMEVISSSGSAAAKAGIPLRELAAISASFVNIAADAAEGGTFLRTAIFRLMDPVSDGRKVFAELGIAIDTATWRSMTFTQKIEALGDKWKDLTNPQQLEAADHLFGIRQGDRGIQMIEDMRNELGRYAHAREVVADAEASEAERLKEMQVLLESNPKAFEIAMTQIKNALTEAIVPLIPTIVMLVQIIADLARKFNELSPETKRNILLFLTLVAVLGPIMMTIGALVMTIGTLLSALVSIGVAVGTVIVFFVTFGNGIFLIIAAFAVLVYAIYSSMDELVEGVSKGLNAMAEVFRVVLNAIADFVVKVVQVIWEALSYLNPFATHSPSLVSQVDAGLTRIIDKYGELTRIRQPLAVASAAMQKFLSDTAGFMKFLDDAEMAKAREGIAAGAPGALGSFDALQEAVAGLKAELGPLQVEIDKQTTVVEQWQAALDRLDDQLKVEEKTLDGLREVAGDLATQLSDANDRLSTLANTPITGMRAMSDEIFANEMAVNALQLAIMDFEDANPAVADLTDQFAKLNGEIEDLRSREKELRMAGATSDILKPLQDQADALEAQRDAMMSGAGGGGPAAELEKMNEELDKLQRAGQRLNLEQSLKFDPLTRQIEQLVEGMHEMPFDEIVAGIQKEQTNIVSLTAAHDQATAAVAEQTTKVDELRAARDAISEVLDREKDKLDALKDAYSAIESAINEMTSAMDRFVSASEKAAQDARGVIGGPGDFPDVAGPGGGLTPDMDTAGMDKMLADLKAKIQEMGAPFGHILAKMLELKERLQVLRDQLLAIWDTSFLEAWNVVWDYVYNYAKDKVEDLAGWLSEKFYSIVRKIGDIFIDLWDEIKKGIDDIKDGFNKMCDWLADRFYQAVRWLGDRWIEFATFLDEQWEWLKEQWNKVKDGVTDAWGKVWEKAKELWSSFKTWIGEEWDAIGENFHKVVDAITGGLSDAWDEIRKFFVNLPGNISGLIFKIGDELRDIGKDIIGKIVEGIKSAPGIIKDALSEMIPDIPGKGTVEKIYGWVNHEGGVVGVDPNRSTTRPYGLHSDETWRMLKKGETVFTQGQMQALGNVMGGGGNSGGGINFYGDLSFPNVTNGDDAEEFISNVEALAATS